MSGQDPQQEPLPKPLRSARRIMVAVGLVSVVIYGLIVAFAEQAAALQARAARENGMAFAEDVVEEQAQHLKLAGLAGAGMGAMFLVFAALLRRMPVPATGCGLAMYVCKWAGAVSADPTLMYDGIVVKVLVTLSLAKAFFTALGYERQRAALAAAPVADGNQAPPSFASYGTPSGGS